MLKRLLRAPQAFSSFGIWLRSHGPERSQLSGSLPPPAYIGFPQPRFPPPAGDCWGPGSVTLCTQASTWLQLPSAARMPSLPLPYTLVSTCQSSVTLLLQLTGFWARGMHGGWSSVVVCPQSPTSAVPHEGGWRTAPPFCLSLIGVLLKCHEFGEPVPLPPLHHFLLRMESCLVFLRVTGSEHIRKHQSVAVLEISTTLWPSGPLQIPTFSSLKVNSISGAPRSHTPHPIPSLQFDFDELLTPMPTSQSDMLPC